MILDTFKPQSLIVQVQYPTAFELWDRAGAVSVALSKIWGALELVETQPNQQVLRGDGIQIATTINHATLTFHGSTCSDQSRLDGAAQSFKVWNEMLELVEAKRVSSRIVYLKDFSAAKDAYAYVRGLALSKWPTDKVFDQPLDGERTAPELAFRFEDEKSFSVLRVKAESRKFEAKLDPQFVENAQIDVSKNYVIIDFDRGLLGPFDLADFRMDAWLEGFLHILRRDIEKVIGKS